MRSAIRIVHRHGHRHTHTHMADSGKRLTTDTMEKAKMTNAKNKNTDESKT